MRTALYFLSQSGLLMLWIFVLVFRSCCYITSCKMKCSVWFGSCWRPRTDKSKETYGVWSLRSRRCLAMGAVLTIKSKIKKRQTWMICGEETFGRGSIIKPNNMKTWINSKFGTKNVQFPVLVSTFYISHRIEALCTWRLRASYSVSWSCVCVVTVG